jgi:hypothetical protein
LTTMLSRATSSDWFAYGPSPIPGIPVSHTNFYLLEFLFSMIMELADHSNTLIPVCWTTWCHIPGDCNLTADRLQWWEVDVTSARLCAMMGFDISSVEPSEFTAGELFHCYWYWSASLCHVFFIVNAFY